MECLSCSELIERGIFMVYAFLSVVNEMRFYQLYDSYESHVPSRTASCYF